MDAELAGAVLQHGGAVALGAALGRTHVGLGARPPHAEHLVAREADRGRFLDRGRVHDAPAPQQHVVGPVLADLQPGRLLLDAGMGDGHGRELEAVHLGALLEQRDRLLAVGRVVIDQHDLLALELVEAAFLQRDVLHDDVGGRPVGAEQREVPLEHAAVARFGAAVAHRDDRDLVDRRLLGQREGDAGAERRDVGRARRALALQPLVALDAAVGGVAGVAFLVGDLDAVDAAVALVDQRIVVGHAVGERDAVRRIGAGAVDQAGNELLVLGLGVGRCGDAGRHDGRAHQR